MNFEPILSFLKSSYKKLASGFHYMTDHGDFFGPVVVVLLTGLAAWWSGFIDLQKLKNEADSATLSLQKEKLDRDISELKDKKDSLSQENSRLMSKNTILDIKNKRLVIQYDTILSQNSKLLNDNTSLNQKNQSLTRANQEALNENINLKNQKIELSNDIKNLPAAMLFFNQLGFRGEYYIDQKEYFKYSGFKKSTEDIININLTNLGLAGFLSKIGNFEFTDISDSQSKTQSAHLKLYDSVNSIKKGPMIILSSTYIGSQRSIQEIFAGYEAYKKLSQESKKLLIRSIKAKSF